MHRFDPSRPGATFRGWLWSVARNRIRDHFRHRRPDAAAGGSTAAEKLGELADPAPDEEPTDATDIARLTQRAMRRVEPEFEPRTWQVFLDAVVLGHPTHVVAERSLAQPRRRPADQEPHPTPPAPGTGRRVTSSIQGSGVQISKWAGETANQRRGNLTGT
jgi:hypothetical protein